MIYSEISHSPQETEQIGMRLAEACTGGRVIALVGDLGAGKTALIRGIARALGYTGNVTSPTFAIVNDYRAGGKTVLYHMDIYRIDADGLDDIGWEDYLASDAPIAVEWAENAEELMPADTIRCGQIPSISTFPGSLS